MFQSNSRIKTVFFFQLFIKKMLVSVKVGQLEKGGEVKKTELWGWKYFRGRIADFRYV